MGGNSDSKPHSAQIAEGASMVFRTVHENPAGGGGNRRRNRRPEVGASDTFCALLRRPHIMAANLDVSLSHSMHLWGKAPGGPCSATCAPRPGASSRLEHTARAFARPQMFKGKKVVAGGILLVAEDAMYTHHLTFEMFKVIVEKHGGKLQSECNSVTDFVVLGEIGARDPDWCVGEAPPLARCGVALPSRHPPHPHPAGPPA
jgi:hypothetical protein